MTATQPHRRHHHHLLLFLLSLVATVVSDELDPLLTLKSSLQSSNPTLFSAWTPTTPPCNFTGITCNHLNSVTGIHLSRQHLAGTLPLSTLCRDLPALETLELGFNSLSGYVSDDLRNCTKLQFLDLGNNFFTGPVPNLSSLSQLKYLYLNRSGFSGEFPWNSLKNMSNLIQISIGDNPFEISEFPKEILGLKNINWIYLSNCSITGKIPSEIGNLSELIDLEVADNYISGSIPVEISKLKKLLQLELYDNMLTGKFPDGFGNLTSLQRFDASSNRLEGDLSELRFLTNMEGLQLFENHFSGEIPSEFGEFKNLKYLSLYNNSLTGPVPQKLGSWTEFDFIDVSSNHLTGLIPPDMCKKGKMRKLLVLQNQFSGEIPASYENCSTLNRIRVSDNLLSGSFPTRIWGLPNVNILDIANNQLEGKITPDIGNAKSLVQIFAANNKLSGNLPNEISMVSSLVLVDFGNNQLTGEIPQNIGQLNQLNFLHLAKNELLGEIPSSLGSCLHLNDLNLAQNSLSGQIPLSIGSIPTLNFLNLSRNEFSGQIPGTLSSLKLTLLDLSFNNLVGPIPDSLTIDPYNGSFIGNNGLCSTDIKYLRPCSRDRSRDYHTFIICITLGSVILLVSIGCYVYRKMGKQGLKFKSWKDNSWDMKSYHVINFTQDEIFDSIKQENLIGKGGFGSVYKVVLKDGKKLAVKHIWNDESGDPKTSKPSTPMLSKNMSKTRRSKAFEMEVKTLSSIRHINVVKLYCSITSEDSSLLVYEYLPNGSLGDRLHDSEKPSLSWFARYEIAVGAARGLEYLHHGCDRPVIHRDVKSSNILLDDGLKSKIADFGLARIVQANSGRDTTRVIAGTYGYIAPEYGYTYRVTEKSDVYSFGVVLMELVTGKKPIEPEFGDDNDIVSWVSSKLKSKESVLSLVDSGIPDPLKEEAIKVLKVAVLCTSQFPKHRPTMRTVIQMLENADPCKLLDIVVNKSCSRKMEERIDEPQQVGSSDKTFKVDAS